MTQNVLLVNAQDLANKIEAARVAATAPIAAVALNVGLSAGAADSKVVTTSPCRLLGFSGNSTYATAIHYLMGFNLTSLPANGTRPDMPALEIAVRGDFSGGWDADGRYCSTGWVFALSSTQATLTVLTGNNMSIDVQYRAA